MITSINQQPVTERMEALVQQWTVASDRRAIFLNCYLLMTRNMLAAVKAGEFHDPTWVDALLHRFADYYFEGLAAYEQVSLTTPAVWQMTHAVARRPELQILQHLLLGVNAHINYDLVLTLVDLLEPEWAHLSAEQRVQRYADHCHVNAIIGRTIDTVQDQVIEAVVPAMDIIDKLLGPLDEWAISRLLTGWREDVWQHALALLELAEPGERERLRQQVEATTLKRAEAILLQENLAALRYLF